MQNFTFTIDVQAESQEQALEKLEAFGRMDAALPHNDFIGIAEFVEDNPNTVALIRTELPKVKGLGTMQIGLQAPALIGKIQEAQKLDDAL